MKIPSKLLKRDSYLKLVAPFMRKPLRKVLSGQRRVGKSYLLFQLIEQILSQEPAANIIYINKEDMEFDAITDAKTLNDYLSGYCKPLQFVELQLSRKIGSFSCG